MASSSALTLAAAAVRFYRRFQQALIGIVGRFAYEVAAGSVATHELPAQPFHGPLIVNAEFHAQEALALTAAHRQQSVARAAAQWFREVEVVAVFGRTFVVALGFHHLRRYHSLALKRSAQPLSGLRILADGLGDDVLRSGDGVFRRFYHVVVHEPARHGLYVAFALQQDDLCQRLQSLFACHLRPRASARFVGQVQILQFRGVPRLFNLLL